MDQQEKQLAQELQIAHLDEQLQIALLSDYYETLDIRLAMALEEALTDEQLNEFAALQKTADDEALDAWVRKVITNYDEIVAAETAAVKADILRAQDDVADAIDSQH